jgi:Sugar (and other) transporter
MQLSVVAVLLSILFFIICCLIPESPRYQAYYDMKKKHTYEFDKAVKLHNLWSEEDLQRKSIVDLFNELKKLNLLSLIGLILVEQFIGGVSILFYMKHFAQLTGEL